METKIATKIVSDGHCAKCGARLREYIDCDADCDWHEEPPQVLSEPTPSKGEGVTTR